MRRPSGNISPAAYSGGAVVFPHQGVSPYTRYAMQMQMHQSAKSQALNQYYDKLQNSINPAGVRDVDLEGWNKKADDWQRFGIENREMLVNPRADGGKAMARFQSMHRDLLGDIQKSKQAAQKELALGKIYADPKKAQMATHNDLDLAHKLSSPIYDKDHYKEDGVTPHDLSEFSFNAPAYDTNKHLKVASEITRGMRQSAGKVSGIDPISGLGVIPVKHSIDNLRTMAERMGGIYDSDRSVQGYYDNQTPTPERIDELNKAYRTIYPKDDIGTDPRKHAMAEAILNNSGSSTMLKPIYHPPQPKGLTKAQQDQQLMLGLSNQMAAAIKSGNVDEAKRLGGAWFSGNGKSNYQDIDQGILTSGMGGLQPKKGFVIKHIDKQWVPDDPKNPAVGSYKDVLNETDLDPNDPQLVNKIARLHQNFMGSTPSLEKGIVGQTLNQGTAPVQTPPTPPAKPAAKDNDPLGLFK
jgi:hypothetical protein